MHFALWSSNGGYTEEGLQKIMGGLNSKGKGVWHVKKMKRRNNWISHITRTPSRIDEGCDWKRWQNKNACDLKNKSLYTELKQKAEIIENYRGIGSHVPALGQTTKQAKHHDELAFVWIKKGEKEKEKEEKDREHTRILLLSNLVYQIGGEISTILKL